MIIRDMRPISWVKCQGARDMLMAVPDRVAPLVVGQTDAHEIHRILADEMRRIAAEVAKMRLPDPEA